MRETKAEIMEGVEHTEAKIVGNNTVEYIKPDGTRVIRFHHTDILAFSKNGEIRFDTGGWKTVTTKQRMNDFQNAAMIFQNKGLWYASIGSYPSREESSWIPYFDGMRVKDGKVLNQKGSPHRKEQILLKKIQKYCDKLRKLKKLPEPSAGDCWYCSFRTEEGGTMGDAFKDEQHLESHLDEKYIHGSLIMNALEHAGYANPVFIFVSDYRDGIVRAVRKYFKSKLGLAS